MPTLYHGTTSESAEHLLSEGWTPDSWSAGGNCGQTRYLYLTNFPENAMWFANEKGGDTVLEVEVPLEDLKVDPEDGVADTVEAELASSHGLPGNVVLIRRLEAGAFRRHPGQAPAPR